MVGVAATALLPVCSALSHLLPAELAGLAALLWDHTTQLDELTASTGAVLALLAALVERGVGLPHSPPLPHLVPRLYPFLGHSSTNVRRAALTTLSSLATSLPTTWLPDCVADLLPLLYKR